MTRRNKHNRQQVGHILLLFHLKNVVTVDPRQSSATAVLCEEDVIMVDSMWPLPAGPLFRVAFPHPTARFIPFVIHDVCKMPLEFGFVCLDKEIAACCIISFLFSTNGLYFIVFLFFSVQIHFS